MRVKLELFAAAVVIAISWAIAHADGVGYKCGGNYNCQTVNCYNAGGDNYSCGLVTAVNHNKCELTGNNNDSCTSVNQNCAFVAFFLGGTCDNNNAPYCNGLATGASKFLLEAGCNP
jgi:hypothetical protein